MLIQRPDVCFSAFPCDIGGRCSISGSCDARNCLIGPKKDSELSVLCLHEGKDDLCSRNWMWSQSWKSFSSCESNTFAVSLTSKLIQVLSCMAAEEEGGGLSFVFIFSVLWGSDGGFYSQRLHCSVPRREQQDGQRGPFWGGYNNPFIQLFGPDLNSSLSLN